MDARWASAVRRFPGNQRRAGPSGKTRKKETNSRGQRRCYQCLMGYEHVLRRRCNYCALKIFLTTFWLLRDDPNFQHPVNASVATPGKYSPALRASCSTFISLHLEPHQRPRSVLGRLISILCTSSYTYQRVGLRPTPLAGNRPTRLDLRLIPLMYTITP